MVKVHLLGHSVSSGASPSKGLMDPLLSVELVSLQTLYEPVLGAAVVMGFLVEVLGFVAGAVVGLLDNLDVVWSFLAVFQSWHPK
jgi:hypothetical protein